MAPCLADDDICFSCGRVISGSRGMGARSKKDFDTSPTGGRAQKGLAPTMRMAELSKRRKKKGKTRTQPITHRVKRASGFLCQEKRALSLLPMVARPRPLLTT